MSTETSEFDMEILGSWLPVSGNCKWCRVPSVRMWVPPRGASKKHFYKCHRCNNTSKFHAEITI